MNPGSYHGPVANPLRDLGRSRLPCGPDPPLV
jgi:hypothetical protein